MSVGRNEIRFGNLRNKRIYFYDKEKLCVFMNLHNLLGAKIQFANHCTYVYLWAKIQMFFGL
jgi:hypothetical protein